MSDSTGKGKRVLRALEYMAAKVAAGGALFLLFMLVTSGWDLYAWSEILHDWMWSMMMIAYAPLYSIITDAISRFFAPKYRLFGKLLLYSLGGFLPFLIWFRSDFFIVLIAGLVGVVCAYVYFVIYLFLHRSGVYSLIAAAIAISILFTLHFHDFTIKRGWSEYREHSSYEASFRLLHGITRVPIEVEKGQLVQFEISWHGSGGHGFSVENPTGGGASMGTVGDFDSGIYSFTADQSGTYNILLKGDRMEGGLMVKWSISSVD